MTKKLFRTLSLSTAVVLSLSASSAFADNIVFSHEAAGAQTPTGTTNYETFSGPINADGTYTTTFNNSGITGTYSSPGGVSIYPADLYGGAGGTGSYMVTQYLSVTTLTLSAQVSYFGLWFSALDSGNVLNFYNGATLVGTFDQQDYIDNVGDCSTSMYCGNPNPDFLDQDPTQQFAYFNITDTNGTFNSVQFEQVAGSSYGRFEFDNNAVAVAAPGSDAPEPSSLILLGTGLVGMAGAVRRRLTK